LGLVIRRLFHISRPVLWINTVGPAAIGMWLSGDLWRWGFLPIVLWLTLPFNLLIYGTNDVFDQETDAKNPRKGTLEGARIRPEEAGYIWRGVVLTNAPFVIYFVVSLPSSATLWITFYALVFTPLALSASPVWPAAVGLMAWSAAKHTFDAVQDIDEDRKVGIETTAVRLGSRGVVLWSGAFWAIATACFALVNVPVALVNAAISGSLLYVLGRNPVPETGHRLYKYSIIFPYVVGTVAGVLLVSALSLGVYP
jgi:4-hydroxybenzoate polyprenyltransferase